MRFIRRAAVAAVSLLVCAYISAIAIQPALAAVDLGNVEIRNEGWRYNMTVIREQAKTSAFKAQQYADYLVKYKITDEYVVAYAKAVAAKFGTGSSSTGNGSQTSTGSSSSANGGTTTDPLANPLLKGVEIRNEGWRYNMTVIREQAKTSAFKAQQYADYLAKYKITDEYVVAYAKAVAAKFGTGGASAGSGNQSSTGNSGSGSSGGNSGSSGSNTGTSGSGSGSGNGGAITDPLASPLLKGVEIRQDGWRYNLTVMKKLGEYSASKRADYIYYRDKNRVTDAFVDAYAAAVAAKFNPDDVGKDIKVTKKSGFVIYQGFRYHGMPNLSSCGLSTDIRILYQDELFGGASKSTPNASHLKNKVVPDLLKRNVTYVMIDIEHWNAVTEMDKLITVVRTLKEGVRAAGNTKMQFGYYMLVPERNYLAPTTRGNRPDRWDAWMATNDKMRRLAAEVDVIFPSLYTPYENRQDWLTYARTNIAEARKYNKPVIPVIWPQYHDTTPGIGTTYMPIKFWEIQMKEIYNLSDSMVIWGSVAFQSKGWDNWDKTREWWPYTRKFAADYTNVPQNSGCVD